MTEFVERLLLESGPLVVFFIGGLYALRYLGSQIVPRWIERMDRDAQLVRDLSANLTTTQADIAAIRKEQETISQRDTQGALRKLETHMLRLAEHQEERDQEYLALIQSINGRLQRMDTVMHIIASGGQSQGNVRCGSSDCPAMQVLKPEYPDQPHNLMERERTDD